MHDKMIPGRTAVDGTGKTAHTATSPLMAAQSLRLAARLDRASGRSAADGLFVTPGWVDVHAHYDGPRPPGIQCLRPHHSAIPARVRSSAEPLIGMMEKTATSMTKPKS